MWFRRTLSDCSRTKTQLRDTMSQNFARTWWHSISTLDPGASLSSCTVYWVPVVPACTAHGIPRVQYCDEHALLVRNLGGCTDCVWEGGVRLMPQGVTGRGTRRCTISNLMALGRLEVSRIDSSGIMFRSRTSSASGTPHSGQVLRASQCNRLERLRDLNRK